MIEKCRLCGEISKKIMTGKILNKYDVKYYDCGSCGYVQTENPFWLEEAYSEAINNFDTGIMARNYANAKLVFLLYLLFFKKIYKDKFQVVDYAGGYGMLVRLLSDLGIAARWHDKYCLNVFSKGFEWDARTRPSMITAFEVFEHFANPDMDINHLLQISDNILFSTYLMPDDVPDINDWWYYGVQHGQHIGFFRRKTLDQIAEKNGITLVTDGVSYHMFTKAKSKFRLFWFLTKFSKISFFKVFNARLPRLIFDICTK